MSNLTTRRQMAAESLMTNEALRESLDDAAAQQLFDWLLPQADAIVETTAAIEDDEEADEAIAPRLKALRKFMRQINQWIAYPDEDPAQMLATLLDQAQRMYGDAWTPPEQARQDAFLQQVSAILTQPVRLIQSLQQLFAGEPHGQTENQQQ